MSASQKREKPLSEEESAPDSQSVPHSEDESRPGRYRWVELCSYLENHPAMVNILYRNLKLLFLSKQRLLRIASVDQSFKQLYQRYDSQTCLKALSTIIDLSEVKMNQYKFMYKKFTLGKAVRLLVSESFFLYRNLVNKSLVPKTEFDRLINSWIDFIFVIHDVPVEAAAQLKATILESVNLHILLRRQQIKGRSDKIETDN